MTPIAETRIPVVIGGRKMTMVFNLNTMSAFEEVRHKLFTETVVKLYQEMEPLFANAQGQQGDEAKRVGLQILQRIPILDLRALLWAALHDYDANDEPHWPLTINQVGRMIGPANMLEVFGAFLRGHQQNLPTREEVGESGGRSAESTPSAQTAASTPANGGTEFTELPEAVYDYPNGKSGG